VPPSIAKQGEAGQSRTIQGTQGNSGHPRRWAPPPRDQNRSRQNGREETGWCMRPRRHSVTASAPARPRIDRVRPYKVARFPVRAALGARGRFVWSYRAGYSLIRDV
jgi:hypothetical protein